ncbi:MAG: heme ABC transporter permease CcmC [Anaplasmataceae bacterium]|nr:heme ABC transporter permease CcmC [Anaplasmataceae bacterium]
MHHININTLLKTKKYIICLFVISIITYIFGIYYGFFVAPIDYLQQETVRIMYIHVPSAWISILIYIAMGMLSAITVIYNNNITDILTYSLAPIGLSFTIICLITGSIWGAPVWGTWWVWDARLTSMLILGLFYYIYINIWDNNKKSSRIASIINIIGLINIPIIKFSVYIWNTLHQKSSIFRSDGLSMDKQMFYSLLIMFLASAMITIVFAYYRIITLLATQKIKRIINNM